MTRRTAGEPKEPILPPPRPSGARPPELAESPGHVAVVMDGNGRWANARRLPRIEGHHMGKATLMDVVAEALEVDMKGLSAYAFSTENRKRSPAEIRFIIGFSRQVLRAQCDDLNTQGVRMRWVGRTPKLWASVLKELCTAEELTRNDTKLTLNMCINYSGRAEIAGAMCPVAHETAEGYLKLGAVNRKTVRCHLYAPAALDVDLLIHTSGELRTSSFLMWESAYAKLYLSDLVQPDSDRRELWKTYETYAERDRRFGGAQDKVPRT